MKKRNKIFGVFFSLCMYLGMNISSQLFVIDIFLQEVLEEIKKTKNSFKGYILDK